MGKTGNPQATKERKKFFRSALMRERQKTAIKAGKLPTERRTKVVKKQYLVLMAILILTTLCAVIFTAGVAATSQETASAQEVMFQKTAVSNDINGAFLPMIAEGTTVRFRVAPEKLDGAVIATTLNPLAITEQPAIMLKTCMVASGDNTAWVTITEHREITTRGAFKMPIVATTTTGVTTHLRV